MAMNFMEVTEKIRESLLEEFDDLKTRKDSDTLSESDLDFYLARDRKAAVILKTLQMELQKEVIQMRKGSARMLK